MNGRQGESNALLLEAKNESVPFSLVTLWRQKRMEAKVCPYAVTAAAMCRDEVSNTTDEQSKERIFSFSSGE